MGYGARRRDFDRARSTVAPFLIPDHGTEPKLSYPVSVSTPGAVSGHALSRRIYLQHFEY